MWQPYVQIPLRAVAAGSLLPERPSPVVQVGLAVLLLEGGVWGAELGGGGAADLVQPGEGAAVLAQRVHVVGHQKGDLQDLDGEENKIILYLPRSI